LHCVCFNLYCGGFILFCIVCVCVCVCVCVYVCMCEFCNVWVFWLYVYCNLTEVFLTLTEVFPCFFLSCKAHAKVKLPKTGRCPHSSTLVVICVVRLLFMLFYVLFVCKCVLPPGDNPIAVNKYIISHIWERSLFTACRIWFIRYITITLDIIY
jgi:hypothetical protein